MFTDARERVIFSMGYMLGLAQAMAVIKNSVSLSMGGYQPIAPPGYTGTSTPPGAE